MRRELGPLRPGSTIRDVAGPTTIHERASEPPPGPSSWERAGGRRTTQMIGSPPRIINVTLVGDSVLPGAADRAPARQAALLGSDAQRHLRVTAKASCPAAQRMLCPGSHRCSSRTSPNRSLLGQRPRSSAGSAGFCAPTLILLRRNEGGNRSPQRPLSPKLGTRPVQSTRSIPLFSRQSARPFLGAGSLIDRLPVGTTGAKPAADSRACAPSADPARTAEPGRRAGAGRSGRAR